MTLFGDYNLISFYLSFQAVSDIFFYPNELFLSQQKLRWV